MDTSDREDCFDRIVTLKELMREFVEATDATESMASVQHAMKALNGLHHARPAIVAAGEPDYLEDRDRELIKERPDGIPAIVEAINELEDINEAYESLQDHLHQVMHRGYVPDHPPQLDDA